MPQRTVYALHSCLAPPCPCWYRRGAGGANIYRASSRAARRRSEVPKTGMPGAGGKTSRYAALAVYEESRRRGKKYQGGKTRYGLPRRLYASRDRGETPYMHIPPFPISITVSKANLELKKFEDVPFFPHIHCSNTLKTRKVEICCMESER